jgi:hypothetical protein
LNRFALPGCSASPNSQHLEKVSANRISDRTANSTRGKNRSNQCSRMCSSRQVAMAVRTSFSSLRPQRSTNVHTCSGSVVMKARTFRIACQRSFTSPSGAGIPGSKRSAAFIASVTVIRQAYSPFVKMYDNRIIIYKVFRQVTGLTSVQFRNLPPSQAAQLISEARSRFVLRPARGQLINK